MREVIRDKGRIEHMLSAIDNVEEFTKNINLQEKLSKLPPPAGGYS